MTRADRKRAYEHVLGVIDAQTAPNQPPGARRPTVLRLVGGREGGAFALDEAENALRAAVENGDVLAWDDHAGHRRYTLAEPDAIRRIAAWEAERDDPRTDVVAWANSKVREVSGA